MKFLIPVLFLLPLSSWAQPEKKGGPGEDHFAERKASIVKRVGEEKAALEQFASCVSGANKGDDLKKCHDQREASMKKIRDEQREERKKHLQEELKRLDEEGKK